MFPRVLLVCLAHTLLFQLARSSQCSDLNLTPGSINDDDRYSIRAEKMQSSNLVYVSLTVKQTANVASWFLMGASDSTNLIGSWQPFASTDGQVIDCSPSSDVLGDGTDQQSMDQAVSNKNSINKPINQSIFTFYWMAPPAFNRSVTFVATIFVQASANALPSLQYTQSIPLAIETSPGRQRYLDVNRSKLFSTSIELPRIRISSFSAFCNSSPCLNGGTCLYDDQYSSCRCQPPWNGVFCNLRELQLSENLSSSTSFE